MIKPNTIFFQIDGNVYSETFKNRLEAMFFAENCKFQILSAKIGEKEINPEELEVIVQKGEASQKAVDESMPPNFHSILGLIDWYGEMAEIERHYRAQEKAFEMDEKRELGEIAMRQDLYH